MFVQNFLFWTQQQTLSCQRIFWGFFGLSLTTSFTVRVTELSQKSSDHSKLSWENEKSTLIFFGLEVYKMRMEVIFVLTVSTNGGRYEYAINWKLYTFLVKTREWLIVNGGEHLCKMEMIYCFHSHDSSFWRGIFTITAKLHNFWSFILKSNARNVAARIALQTFVTVFNIFSTHCHRNF